MEFQVRAPSIELDEPTRAYIEHKIGAAVGKHVRGKARVDVEVSEEAPGHGASIMRVKVHVALPHAPPETVQADEPEIRAAADLAADKIGRALRRNKGKRRDRARQAPEAPVA